MITFFSKTICYLTSDSVECEHLVIHRFQNDLAFQKELQEIAGEKWPWSEPPWGLGESWVPEVQELGQLWKSIIHQIPKIEW